MGPADAGAPVESLSDDHVRVLSSTFSVDIPLGDCIAWGTDEWLHQHRNAERDMIRLASGDLRWNRPGHRRWQTDLPERAR